MVKKFLLALVVIVVGLVAIVALQPTNFRLSRSATMAAPPADVFALVNDFHAWQDWSPWAKIDPNAKSTFEGPDSGTGAVFKWSGNEEVGEGSMTITDSHPSDRIQIKLAFIKPFENQCDVEFAFKPEENGTLVTWSMSGQNNFISKAVCMFMNMDQMVGKEYEKGLADLKSIVEKPKNEEPAKTTSEPPTEKSE